jgi:hypothetical protein
MHALTYIHTHILSLHTSQASRMDVAQPNIVMQFSHIHTQTHAHIRTYIHTYFHYIHAVLYPKPHEWRWHNPSFDLFQKRHLEEWSDQVRYSHHCHNGSHPPPQKKKIQVGAPELNAPIRDFVFTAFVSKLDSFYAYKTTIIMKMRVRSRLYAYSVIARRNVHACIHSCTYPHGFFLKK